MSELGNAISDYVGSVTVVEVGALVFGLLYVLLASREKLLCWPAGIIASVLALTIAARSNYRLDVVKESYYILMGFYGWYAWVAGRRRSGVAGVSANERGRTAGENDRPVRDDAIAGVDRVSTLISGPTRPIIRYSTRQHVLVLAFGVGLSLVAGFAFDRLGSSLPYLDAGTTVFAFITTWLVTQKVLENWLYWIVINAASFYMYMLNGYYVFSLLMLIYIAISISGFVAWRTQFQQQARHVTG